MAIPTKISSGHSPTVVRLHWKEGVCKETQLSSSGASSILYFRGQTLLSWAKKPRLLNIFFVLHATCLRRKVRPEKDSKDHRSTLSLSVFSSRLQVYNQLRYKEEINGILWSKSRRASCSPHPFPPVMTSVSILFFFYFNVNSSLSSIPNL